MTLLATAIVFLLGACASAATQAEPVRFCAGTCGLPPVAPLPEECSAASVRYRPDGTPTDCYYIAELNRVAPAVATCSQKLGVVAAEFHFVQDGSARSVRAVVDCEHCRMPEFVELEPFLRCVEQAASKARLPLAPEQNEFRIVFLYRVGTSEDPRLDLGWAPMESATR